MAQLALGLAGAGIGGAAFGTTGMSIGWTIGTTVGAMLFGPKPPDTEGPRLSDLTVSSSTDGSDIPILFGTQRAAGQIIWADKIKEKKHEEDAGGKGGSSGTYTSYSYYATFAISFGHCQTSAVRRIWANKRLIYDARPEATKIKGKNLKFELYKGTETQTPDPTIENKVGVGNVSAYRGQSYIVFRNLPLEKYGNRIPSIEAEIVIGGSSSTSLSSTDVYTTSALTAVGRQFMLPSNELVYQSYFSTSGYSVVIATEPHTQTVKYNYSANTYTAQSLAGYFVGGDYSDYHIVVYQVNGAARNFELWTAEQTWLLNFDSGSNNLNGSMIDCGGTTTGSVLLYRTNAYRCWPKTGSTGYAVAAVPTGYSLLTTFAHCSIQGTNNALIPLYRTSDNAICFSVLAPEGVASGGTWGTPVVDGTYTTSTLSILDDAVYVDTADEYLWPAQYTSGGNYPALVSTDSSGNILQMYDLRDYAPAEDGVFSASVRPILSYDNDSGYVTFAKAGYVYFWDHAREELTYVSGLSSKVEWPFYHAQSDTIITGDLDNSSKVSVDFLRVNGVGTAVVDAADIVEHFCGLAGIPASDLSLTGYTDTVRGYRHSRRTTARADIEPLLAVTNSDAVQSDWKLKVVNRGGSVVDTIDATHLNAHEFGTDSGSLVVQKMPQNVDLPKSLNVHYMSSDADYQFGNALAQWYSSTSERQASVNFPVVMSDAEALDLADQLLMQSHEQEIFSFKLPRGYGALEPTDPISLPVADETYRVRVTGVDRGANGLLSFNAIADDANHLTANTEAGEAQTDDQEVETTSAGIPMVIPTNLLRDADHDNLGFYITAYTYASGFNPMAIYRSIAGADFELVGTIASEPIIGVVDGALTNTALDAWDTSNTLTIKTINNGTLSTRTDAEILSGMNAAIVGNNVRWEVIQFVNATATDSTTWELTRLLRYRRGTDRKLVDGGVSIQDGDWFIYLGDTSSMIREPIAYAELAKTYSYKAVPYNGVIDDATAVDATVSAFALKPYSGAEPDASWSGSDVTVSWTRRTRRGGFYGGTNGLIDGIGGAIAEDSEEYEIDIYDNASPPALARAVTGLSSPTYTYTAANIASDGFVSTDVITFHIYQISATADRGYKVEVDATVP